MPLLIIVSLLWAFSFGLTKGLMTGINAPFIATARLGLALLVFLPFLRLTGVAGRTRTALLGIGALQFGVMYLAYNESFLYLPAYAVALCTITTPLFVTLAADALDRTFRPRALLAAALAVAGTALVVLQSATPSGTLHGVLLVQAANAAFAVGQVLYRRVRRWPGVSGDREVFGLLYAGAFLLTLLVALQRGSFAVTPTPTQIATLLYLGIIASGLGFFLWNKGATQVGAGTLAVMNNAKIPLTVACSLLVFGEGATADLPRLLASLAILAGAVWLAEKR
jgi:drug/metabolite transporter (DMT)-like permease